MSAASALPGSLVDCVESHDNELLIVEGVSAANAIKSVRDRRCHAVLPMQGKIPNASRATLDRLLEHPNIADLVRSLHPHRSLDTQMDSCRYQRIIVLSDPDADGIHAAILLLLFMLQHMSSLIEQGRLFLLRAPLYGFYANDKCVAVAYSEQHAVKVQDSLSDNQIAATVKRHFKGVASLDENLRLALLAPDNPVRRNLSIEDCTDLCKPLLQ